MSVKNYSTHRMLEYMQTLYCAKKTVDNELTTGEKIV